VAVVTPVLALSRSTLALSRPTPAPDPAGLVLSRFAFLVSGADDIRSSRSLAGPAPLSLYRNEIFCSKIIRTE
jgi:hypothetical protein